MVCTFHPISFSTQVAKSTSVAHVGPNQFHVGMLFLELGQQQFRSFPIRDVRCVNLDFQQKSQGIYEDMPLATVCFFAPS